MNLDLKLRRAEPGTDHEAGAPTDLVVGGLPTVSLLPAELRSAGRERAIKQALVFAIFTAVLVAAGLVGLAAVVNGNAQQRLTAAQTTGQQLQVQVAKFADVQRLSQGIALGNAAVKVGASTEVDWQAQLAAIERDMPSGYTVSTIVADNATPVADYPQGTTPIEKPRAATAVLSLTTPSVTELPIWLRKLRSIPAYADAVPTVSYDPEQGYTVQLTVHLSAKAIIAKPAQEVGQ